MAGVSRKGIVVTTSAKTKDWLAECLEAIGPQFEVLVVGNHFFQPDADLSAVNSWNGFELGGILRGMELFDEFIYIPDTVIVKDWKVLKEILDTPGGVMLSPHFLSYIGKYDSKVLREIGVPKVYNKHQAVDHEFSWTQKYIQADKGLTIFREMLPSDTFIFKEKNGRNNMVNECSWVVKYKGCWHRDMI